MKAYLWIAAVSLAAACGGERKAEARTADEPTEGAVVLGASDVATATLTDVTVGIPVSGTLEPAVDVRIKSPIPELLEAVLVKEGERVQRGQVLARFRTDAARTAALSTEAQKRLAAADHERMQNLFKEGAVSQRDVDNAEASWRAADAAAVQAEQRLQDATVRAPVSGVIAERSIEGGDRIKDGDPMFRLVNTAQLEFAAAVPSQFVGTVRVGMPVSLTVSGLSGTMIGGRVSRVNATADPATRQVKVYVIVPNTNGQLVGGLFASGRVVTKQSAKTLAVPRAAVRSASDRSQFVLTLDSNRVVRKAVETGSVDELRGLVEITKGLSGGETVIVAAAEGLREGDRVSVTGREGGR
jgi:membrane fusion protein, multidrug efflux system